MEFNDNTSDGADQLMSQWCQKELTIQGENADEHTSTCDGSWLGLGHSSFSSLHQAQQTGVLQPWEESEYGQEMLSPMTVI